MRPPQGPSDLRGLLSRFPVLAERLAVRREARVARRCAVVAASIAAVIVLAYGCTGGGA